MVAEPTFTALDTDSLQVPIPKGDSGTGRKLSENPAAVRARKHRAAKKAAAPQSAPKRRASSARGAKSLRPEIGALLTMANTFLIMSPVGTRPVEAMTDPSIEPTRVGYELDTAEIDALASALDAQCRRSPRFRKVIENMLTASSGGALVTVLGMIAARRMARAGVLPPMLDPMLGLALSGDNLGALVDMAQPEPAPAPDPVTGEREPIPLDFDSIDGGMPLGMEP